MGGMKVQLHSLITLELYFKLILVVLVCGYKPVTQGLTFPSYETYLCTFISNFHFDIYQYMTPQTQKNGGIYPFPEWEFEATVQMH